jgi:hypothetical protein
MTEEERKMAADPYYAAYCDIKNNIFKGRPEDPIYQEIYEKEWKYLLKIKDFFKSYRQDQQNEEDEEEKKPKNKRQTKRASRKKPPMTEEEKKERRKEKQRERYYKEKDKMENDPKYAAYQDYRKGVFKYRSNDPEYQRKYQEEWNFHANMYRQKQPKYDERFFGYRPPPSPPSQKQYDKPKDKEKQEKEYQEELKAKKDLIDSDQFRCVEPYKKGDDNVKNRLKSCKRSGNYKKGYPTFFNTLQQCVEYCNEE